MSKLTPYWFSPAFLRRKSNGIHLDKDDCIQITLREDVDPGELAKELRGQPIEITVLSVYHARKKGLRILYSAPWGVQVRFLRSGHTAATQLNARHPIRGVHRSLVLTRYPQEAVHWFPAMDPEEAARDLLQNAIFINIAKIINERVSLQIRASDKWTVLRSELEPDTHAYNESTHVSAAMSDVCESYDTMPASASAATLRFEQLTQLAVHYHDALADFPTELAGDDAIRTLSQDQIARFLTVERQIRRQHTALENSLSVLDYDE